MTVELGNLSAVYHLNAGTGKGFVTGDASAITARLATSHDAQLLRSVLPAVAAKGQASQNDEAG